MSRKQKKLLIRIGAAAALFLLLLLLPLPAAVDAAALVGLYLFMGFDTLRKAWRGIRNGQPFDENFLMAVATAGALALGNFREAAAVMLFYRIGEWFESYAVGKSRKSISSLMDIRPDYANVLTEDGRVVRTDPAEVPPGTRIEVRAGERIPLDGIVEAGSASLDTAALTGESMPRSAVPGDGVLSGCIDLNGVLTIRTTRDFETSAASRILELVEEASSRKSRAENFITKFAGIYTPAVCGCALALAVLPPLFRLLASETPQWTVWLYRALTFLVISCPCALVISIPLTFFAGLGGAGREGILIKGSNYMETLSKVRCVVFDKTGTLTEGQFRVTEICPSGLSEQELLRYVAAAEAYSNHPLAECIRAAWDGGTAAAEKQEEFAGEGLTAEVEGRRIAAGNERLMHRLGIEAAAYQGPGTVIHAAVDGRYAGYIVAADRIRTGAPEAIRRLRDSGVDRIIMLTGDREAAGRKAAEALGIDEVYCGLLPGDKVERMETILKEAEGRGGVAFVGDGMNDAPVLARADVGVAMGALGSDAAIEAADVVLMDDDPRKISRAMGLARRSLNIVRENIWFAIGVKLICLCLGAAGHADMWLAIFADVGVMVLAVLNAIRALGSRSLSE